MNRLTWPLFLLIVSMVFVSCDASAAWQFRNEWTKYSSPWEAIVDKCGPDRTPTITATNDEMAQGRCSWYQSYSRYNTHTIDAVIGSDGVEGCENGVSDAGHCITPVSPCSIDSVLGSDLSTGGATTGIFQDSEGCAVECSVNYELLDGSTSLADAMACNGLGELYTSDETDDYASPSDQCQIELSGQSTCLDMTQQPGGSCASGTTYGRVNGIEVCVPSDTVLDPLDAGSVGTIAEGGDMQEVGTADEAGTGGGDTGSGTSTGSGNTTTTDNGDGTSTTESNTETEITGPKTFGGHGDPSSWWESNYPDGAEGIASKFSEDMGNGPFLAILDPLKSLPDGGTAPVWSMDFNIGSLGNYGSMSFEVPSGVWLFVRFCILFTAVMTVRKLIFGG